VQFLKAFLDDLEIDFVGRRHVVGLFSIVAVILSWVVFFAIGPNWGIDFTGGTELHLRFSEVTEISEVRQALRARGLSDDAVQEVGGADSQEFVVRIQDATYGMDKLAKEIRTKVSAAYGEDWVTEFVVDAEVGARFVLNYSGDIIERGEVQSLVEDLGIQVRSGKEENQYIMVASGLAMQIKDGLQEALGKEFEVLSIDAVGPKVGGELRRQGFLSIATTLLLVLLYVAFRFDIGFAPGAVLALFHDVSLTIGIFVLAQLEFNLPMIGALLTIVGYSLNDTIVIYDRIRENTERYRRKDVGTLINVSINETLTRTVATSVTTMLAIGCLILMGGDVIRNFALAMFLGIIFGTYSTVFVASPMILIMEDVKPWLARFIDVDGGDEEVEEEEVEADELIHESITESELRRRARALAQERGDEG
jgi:preprotein translocase subunit SecF